MDGFETNEGCGPNIWIQKPEKDNIQLAIRYELLTSNNEAKYEALIRATRTLADFGADKIILHSDLRLVVQQVLETYEKKEERMKKHFEQVGEMKKKFHNLFAL